MAGNLQPKGLFELAFRSFISHMENEALQLLELDPSPETVAVTSRACSELKRFFHGTRLPISMTNQLTKHLLIKLDSLYHMVECSIHTACGQHMLLSLVEAFLHPDVTAIELGPSYYHEFDFTHCNFITWMILKEVCNLPNLEILNLPSSYFIGEELKLVFPCQLKELTIQGSPFEGEDILRSVVESCPELKCLTICDCCIRNQDITLVLQCKHLERLRLSEALMEEDTVLTLIKGLSTDNASDVLSASSLKSLSLTISEQNTLRLIVDKLPHLTEIKLRFEDHVDLSDLTQLKNLRSLSLEPFVYKTTEHYNKILHVLGKNLVFLELTDQSDADIEIIGETCTRLKCLHIRDVSCLEDENHSWKPMPNFGSIECLRISSYHAEDFVAFLIAQCVNIKILIEENIEGILNPAIEDVLRRTPPPKWVVIEYDRNDRHLFDSLPARHPNFHAVKTGNWIRLSSQAEVFDSLGCHRPA